MSSLCLLCSRVGDRWFLFFFFFNDTATTEIYTLSLHDALPIYQGAARNTQRFRKQTAFHRNAAALGRSEEHTSELQSHLNLVCRLLLEKKKTTTVKLSDTSQKQSYNVASIATC